MDVKFLFGWAKENGIDLPKNSDGNINIPASFELYNEWKKKGGNTKDSDMRQNKTITKGLEPFSEHEKQNWAASKKIIIAESKEKIEEFIKKSIANDESVQGKTLFLGKLDNKISEKIKEEVGASLNGYNLKMSYSDIRHAIGEHGDEVKESLRGQRAINANDILNFVDVITEFDEVKIGDTKKDLVFMKRIGQKNYAITYYADGSHALNFKTFYVSKK